MKEIRIVLLNDVDEPEVVQSGLYWVSAVEHSKLGLFRASSKASK